MNSKTEVLNVFGSIGIIGSSLIHKLAEKHRDDGFSQVGYSICRLLLSIKL